MPDHEVKITGSLEDYLETIYRILRVHSVARVKDIALEMDVSPASVSPAMKRLADKELIRYSKRNYIELTEKGLFLARRTITRHNLLSRFLTEILGIDTEQAETDACSMEHYLSNTSMERLAAFFEFLAACPDLRNLIDIGFDSCRSNQSDQSSRCIKTVCPLTNDNQNVASATLMRLAEVEPGRPGRIARINADRKTRGELIDSGFIQGVNVTLRRPGSNDLPCIIELDGYDQKLPMKTAECVHVYPLGEDENEK